MKNLTKHLKENDFSFKKKFGQNFITDGNLLEAIVLDAKISKTCDVLEIGCGAGTLTKVLANSCNNLIGYEIDKDLKPILKEKLKDNKNTQIIFEDIMNVDDEMIRSNFSGEFKIVANLPYYITTPILFKFLEGNFNIKSITVMVQKEVAERLCAKEGTKNYGAITASIGYRADAKITRIVNRNMFKPAPNVDSAIVNIKINENKFDVDNRKVLKSLIKSAFAMRRKTLSNNLKKSFNLSASQIEKLYDENNLERAIRGEALSLQQLVNLSNSLSKIL